MAGVADSISLSSERWGTKSTVVSDALGLVKLFLVFRLVDLWNSTGHILQTTQAAETCQGSLVAYLYLWILSWNFLEKILVSALQRTQDTICT